MSAYGSEAPPCPVAQAPQLLPPCEEDVQLPTVSHVPTLFNTCWNTHTRVGRRQPSSSLLAQPSAADATLATCPFGYGSTAAASVRVETNL